MKGHWIKYSGEELDFIKRRSRLMRPELHAQFVKRFRRRDVTVGHLNALCKRMGWRTGRTGQIQKGAVPHNKGKKCAPGSGGRHPNARKSQFKKGEPAAQHQLRGPRARFKGWLCRDQRSTDQPAHRLRALLRPETPLAVGTGARPGARGHVPQVQGRSTQYRSVELGACAARPTPAPQRAVRSRLRRSAGRDQADDHGRCEAGTPAARKAIEPPAIRRGYGKGN
jgi:hypothetical protein